MKTIRVLSRDPAGCDAGTPAFDSATPESNVVTYVFTPPDGPASVVVRASALWCAASFPAQEAACEALLGSADGLQLFESVTAAVGGRLFVRV